ncbi:ComEC/Rec2 family competence protein [Paracoccus binzhouensis]|uniref:metallohydrolase n=1 Tax=Paracoccus binzhouensis TaxID=2796149 RepID=UPI0018EEFE32|nr:metallohydrolase [Paracoccus binzhouensis]
MASKITLFPVGNGDMTLIETDSGRKILIDLNIRAAADDSDDDTPDVASMLRERLERDADGRLYLDALLLSHPDKDHCTGLRKHFHLGPPDEWSKKDDKIFIREMWSSPMVFRRASRNNVLCDDAKAFNTEARRRVQKFRDVGGIVGDGDRILILGEDENGKTDDLTAILVRGDETFSRINGQYDWSMTARLLAPLPKTDDDEEEEALSKNQSSTILQFSLAGDQVGDRCRFLTGGDAEVAIWERLWQRHSWRSDWLSYDILQTPHHCSWHSLSHDSWSEMGEDAEVCEDARNALSQARDGATIVASSKPIKDDDSDPPCIRAKREYVAIADGVNGTFKCVGEHPSEKSPDVMEFEIGKDGPRLKTKLMKAATVLSSGVIGGQPLAHG